jgi:hypothetical protein
MAMILKYGNEQHELTKEDMSKGGKKSGEVRREKAELKRTLELLLNEQYKNTGKSYKELATLGLIKGAVNGKAENYKVIAQMLGELEQSDKVETPEVNINIVDNTELEKVLYEDSN